jgi:hypothetical protein
MLVLVDSPRCLRLALRTSIDFDSNQKNLGVFRRNVLQKNTHGAMREGIPNALRRCLSTRCPTSVPTRDSQANVGAF